MLKGSGWRKGQECAHSWLKNHPLGFIGRGKVLTQALWPGMEARVRGNDGKLEAPSTQAVDADRTYTGRSALLRNAILNRLRFGRDGGVFEGAVTNIVPDQDFSTWNLRNGMTAGDITSGQLDPGGGTLGFTLRDDSAVNFESCRPAASLTIADNSTGWTTAIFIKKDSDTSRFPEFQLSVSGGTIQTRHVQVNTSTGALVVRTSAGTGSQSVEDFNDDFWLLIVTIFNNSSGNTVLTSEILPAAGTTIGTISAATTGSISVAFPQIANIDFAPTYVHTTGAAATGDADDLRYDNTGDVLAEPGTGSVIVTVLPEYDGTEGGDASIVDTTDAGNANGINLRADAGVPQFTFTVQSGSSNVANIGGTAVPTRGVKITLGASWAVANFRLYESGVEVSNDLAGAAPVAMDDVLLGLSLTMSGRAFASISRLTITQPVLSARQFANVTAVSRKAA